MLTLDGAVSDGHGIYTPLPRQSGQTESPLPVCWVGGHLRGEGLQFFVDVCAAIFYGNWSVDCFIHYGKSVANGDKS